MEATSLFKLPKQPLPPLTLHAPIVVLIWWATIFVLSSVILSGWIKKRVELKDFAGIKYGAYLLNFYYVGTTVERWLHWTGSHFQASYGHLVVHPIMRIPRVLSGLILAWSTYKLVWNELEVYFRGPLRNWWWRGAKIFFFFLVFISLYYLVLFLDLAIVWLQFLSLKLIDAIAFRRTQCEIATDVLFVGFGLFTVGAALVAIGRTRTGYGRNASKFQYQLLLLLGTVLLFARSLFDVALIVPVFQARKTRTEQMFKDDVGYGVLSILYLGAMLASAYVKGPEASDVRSDLRKLILERLRQRTDNRRDPSPTFSTFLQELYAEIPNLVGSGVLGGQGQSQSSAEEKEHSAREYLQELRDTPRDALTGPSAGAVLAGENPDSHLSRQSRHQVHNRTPSGASWTDTLKKNISMESLNSIFNTGQRKRSSPRLFQPDSLSGTTAGPVHSVLGRIDEDHPQHGVSNTQANYELQSFSSSPPQAAPPSMIMYPPSTTGTQYGATLSGGPAGSSYNQRVGNTPIRPVGLPTSRDWDPLTPQTTGTPASQVSPKQTPMEGPVPGVYQTAPTSYRPTRPTQQFDSVPPARPIPSSEPAPPPQPQFHTPPPQQLYMSTQNPFRVSTREPPSAAAAAAGRSFFGQETPEARSAPAGIPPILQEAPARAVSTSPAPAEQSAASQMRARPAQGRPVINRRPH